MKTQILFDFKTFRFYFFCYLLQTSLIIRYKYEFYEKKFASIFSFDIQLILYEIWGKLVWGKLVLVQGNPGPVGP